MITIKSEQDKQAMLRAGGITYDALQAVKEAIRPGISTLELDEIAERVIRKAGAVPSFKGYNGYPKTLCTSIDDEVVHGIPSADVILREGQIISIDCGAFIGGFHGDSAFTAPVGKVSEQAQKLIDVTEQSFWEAAKVAREGNRIGDIGHAVQSYCAQFGFEVVRDMCGHGVGQQMHEDPQVPNYGKPGRGVRLSAGMTIAVEPMVVTGKYAISFDEDQWTTRTKDGGLCSHYEHSMFIMPDGAPPLILTLPQTNGSAP